MKEKILKWLSLIGKLVGLASATGTLSFLPEKYALPIFAAASILKDTVNRIGDYLDDGKENQSFKV